MSLHLNIEMTDRCNLKCIMCGQFWNRPTVHPSADHFIHPETWKRIILNLRNIGEEVHLCPHWLGEPTIHPKFGELLDFAFRKNAEERCFRMFKLHTNGIFLGKERIRHLLRLASLEGPPADTFRYIHFAVDAYSREVFIKVKGGDFRDRVYENITNFLDMRGGMGLVFPLVTLCFVVMPENRGEAGDFVSFWKERIEATGREARVVWDWPVEPFDSIYLRRLNTKDQRSATLLHREVLEGLGLLKGGEEPDIVDESF